MSEIGIADLSHKGSELVRQAEGGKRFSVTRQGRDTGVDLARRDQSAIPRTASLAAAMEALAPSLTEEQMRQRLEEVEHGREDSVEVP